MKHASIIPLIGGETIAQMKAFDSRPEYLLSYKAFINNDSHLVNYLKDIPYYVLDDNTKHPYSVDVVNTVCPCAGLSSLSTTSSSDSAINDWMTGTAKYVLEEIKPKVFWGENSPRFASKLGAPIVEKLLAIAKVNGYTMSIYRTKSLLHGLSQVRERSFYFFWAGDKVPIFNYFETPYLKIEDFFKTIPTGLSQQDLTNTKTPSKDDFYYKFILEELEGGISHSEFVSKLSRSTDVLDWIESKSNYGVAKLWADKYGYSRMSRKTQAMSDKLASGGNIMRRMTYVPKDRIGAFVGHFPTSMTHTEEDRYLTVRECMSLMGLPNDFELLNPTKNLNHVCQNVPVSTAYDMASEIKAVLEGKREMVSGNLIYQYNNSKTYETKDLEQTTLETFFN